MRSWFAFVLLAAYVCPRLAFAGCEELMVAAPDYRLRIGVLFYTKDRQLIMTASPYAGSQHGLVYKKTVDLIHPPKIDKILWSGEVTLRGRGQQIEIRQANETSSWWAELPPPKGKERFIMIGDRKVVAENNYENIPEGFRSEDFVGIHWSKERERLAAELEGKGNVRHAIGNILGNLSALPRVFGKGGNESRHEVMLAEYQERNQSDFQVIRWLIDHLKVDNRLEEQAVFEISNTLRRLEEQKITLGDIREIDEKRFEEEMELLKHLATPDVGNLPSKTFLYE